MFRARYVVIGLSLEHFEGMYKLRNFYILKECRNCTISTFWRIVQIAQFVHFEGVYKLCNLYILKECTNCTISTFRRNVQIAHLLQFEGMYKLHS